MGYFGIKNPTNIFAQEKKSGKKKKKKKKKKKIQARSEIRNKECYTEEKNFIREHAVRKIFLVHEWVWNKNNHAYTK